MIESIIGSVIGVGTDIANMLIASDESKRLAEQIRKEQVNKPVELDMLQQSAAELARQGMPGYELYKEGIGEQATTNLERVKQIASSPSAIIGMAAQSLADTNRAYNQLAVSDANARLQNIRGYQNVLGDVAGRQTARDMFNTQTNLSALRQEAEGTRAVTQGLENIGAKAISGISNYSANQYNKDYLNMLKGYFDNFGAEETKPVSYMPVTNIPSNTPSITPQTVTPQTPPAVASQPQVNLAPQQPNPYAWNQNTYVSVPPTQTFPSIPAPLYPIQNQQTGLVGAEDFYMQLIQSLTK